MSKEFWDIFKKILCISFIIFCIFTIFRECSQSRRYKEQLNSISESISGIEQSNKSIRDGFEQQKSLIDKLGEQQSRIEQSVGELEDTVQQSNRYLSELIGSEQNVDGSVGAIRSTSSKIESIISTTLDGIIEEGIQ